VAAAVGTEICTGADEAARLVYDRCYLAINFGRRDGLGAELRSAGVTRSHDLRALGVSGQHNDRHIGCRAVIGGTDQRYELNSIQRLHRNIDDQEVHFRAAKDFKCFDRVMSFDDVLDSEAVQDRFHQIDHVVVVVDHHHSQSREPKVRHAGNFDLSENVTCVLLAYN